MATEQRPAACKVDGSCAVVGEPCESDFDCAAYSSQGTYCDIDTQLCTSQGTEGCSRSIDLRDKIQPSGKLCFVLRDCGSGTTLTYSRTLLTKGKICGPSGRLTEACEVCSDYTCSQCIPGFALTSGGSCARQCQIGENMVECVCQGSHTQQNCDFKHPICDEFGVCQQIPCRTLEKCRYCQDPQVCDTCQDGYIVDQILGAQCVPRCTGQLKTDCQCVQSLDCGVGSFCDSQFACQSCDRDCDLCTSDICLQCSSNHGCQASLQGQNCSKCEYICSLENGLICEDQTCVQGQCYSECTTELYSNCLCGSEPCTGQQHCANGSCYIPCVTTHCSTCGKDGICPECDQKYKLDGGQCRRNYQTIIISTVTIFMAVAIIVAVIAALLAARRKRRNRRQENEMKNAIGQVSE